MLWHCLSMIAFPSRKWLKGAFPHTCTFPHISSIMNCVWHLNRLSGQLNVYLDIGLYFYRKKLTCYQCNPEFCSSLKFPKFPLEYQCFRNITCPTSGILKSITVWNVIYSSILCYNCQGCQKISEKVLTSGNVCECVGMCGIVPFSHTLSFVRSSQNKSKLQLLKILLVISDWKSLNYGLRKCVVLLG